MIDTTVNFTLQNIFSKQLPKIPSHVVIKRYELLLQMPLYISERLTWRKPHVLLSSRMQTVGTDLAQSQDPHFTSTLSHSQLLLWWWREREREMLRIWSQAEVINFQNFQSSINCSICQNMSKLFADFRERIKEWGKMCQRHHFFSVSHAV